MANTKISALPTFTGDTSGVYLVMDNNGLDETYKVTKENLLSNIPQKVTGSWTVPTGASTQSFTVDPNQSYVMWVNGNIPNGIIVWNANVSISNTNVAVVGNQYGWYYVTGNALVLTSMPLQIIGTSGSIITTEPVTSTANVFSFGITNNSGSSQVINYGYMRIS